MSKMEYTSYFRPEIDNMGGYTPGEQPKMANLLKLNTNETPLKLVLKHITTVSLHLKM